MAQSIHMHLLTKLINLFNASLHSSLIEYLSYEILPENLNKYSKPYHSSSSPSPKQILIFFTVRSSPEWWMLLSIISHKFSLILNLHVVFYYSYCVLIFVLFFTFLSSIINNPPSFVIVFPPLGYFTPPCWGLASSYLSWWFFFFVRLLCIDLGMRIWKLYLRNLWN